MSQNICKHKKKLLSLHKRVLPSPSPSPPSVAYPQAPPPRHLRWLTPPLMEGSEWPWLLKAPPRATFGGLPLPLTQV